MTKEQIIEQLKSSVVNISFLKKDGTVREMNATLNDDITPVVESKGTKKKNDSVMSVWDVDVSGWRSFRWDSLQVVNGENFQS